MSTSNSQFPNRSKFWELGVGSWELTAIFHSLSVLGSPLAAGHPPPRTSAIDRELTPGSHRRGKRRRMTRCFRAEARESAVCCARRSSSMRGSARARRPQPGRVQAHRGPRGRRGGRAAGGRRARRGHRRRDAPLRVLRPSRRGARGVRQVRRLGDHLPRRAGARGARCSARWSSTSCAGGGR